MRCWLMLVAVSFVPAVVVSADRPPNVLLIVSDDQRPDTIHALGNPRIDTPHLDALCQRGTAFTRAVVPNPICTPSRAEIMTGCSSFKNGVIDFGNPIDPKLITWAAAMSAAGYDTWYVGKWHNDGKPTQRGYDATSRLFAGGGGRWAKEQQDWRGRKVTGYTGWIFQDDQGKLFPELGIGLTPNISATLADAAIALISQQHDRPFFLHVNFTAPHDPLLFPPGYESKYKPEDMQLPENFLPEHPFDHGNFRGRDEQLMAWPRTEREVREELACYYAVISHLDAQVGRVIKTLEERRELERTIVIFTSDHGLALGSHGLRGKQNMYEHTIGVPLIMAGPGVPRGQKTGAQCLLRDLYPTICEMTGAAAPKNLEGRSLVPLLAGTAKEIYPFVCGYFREFQRMIRTDRWKLIEYPQIGRRQLFDLANDPAERRDLAGDNVQVERVAELHGQMQTWLKSAGDKVQLANP